jgi:arylsulfatase A-like enzyme
MKSKLVLVPAVFSIAATALSGQNKQPNVIIIYTDDQGSLDLNCFGATDLKTPNIDALSEKGTRFTQFYGAPISTPSRASLLTGQFTRHAGLWDNAGATSCLPPEKVTIAQKMKENGYATALIGKWHLGESKEASPNTRGFDYFFGHRGGCIDNFSHFFYWNGPNRHDLWRNYDEVFYYGQFFPEITVREIKNFVNDHKQQPFFLYWAINMPHYPVQGSPKWNEYYKNLPYPRNLYAAFVSTLDETVGEVITFLDREGLRENTIIIYQADNGHSVETRNHNGGGFCGNYRGAKFSMFEGGIRVPAIISWQGHLPENQVREQMAMNIDWYPTIAELCHIELKGMDIDGKSLLPVIRNPQAASPHDILYFDSGNQWAVRKDDWKLIGNPQDPINPQSITSSDSLCLSNLKTDITESENLIKKYPQVAGELIKLRNSYANKYLDKK